MYRSKLPDFTVSCLNRLPHCAPPRRAPYCMFFGALVLNYRWVHLRHASVNTKTAPTGKTSSSAVTESLHEEQTFLQLKILLHAEGQALPPGQQTTNTFCSRAEAQRIINLWWGACFRIFIFFYSCSLVFCVVFVRGSFWNSCFCGCMEENPLNLHMRSEWNSLHKLSFQVFFIRLLWYDKHLEYLQTVSHRAFISKSDVQNGVQKKLLLSISTGTFYSLPFSCFLEIYFWKMISSEIWISTKLYMSSYIRSKYKFTED